MSFVAVLVLNKGDNASVGLGSEQTEDFGYINRLCQALVLNPPPQLIQKTQMATSSVNKQLARISKEFGDLGLHSGNFATKPSAGKGGKPIELCVNFYPIALKEGVSVYQYDVEFRRYKDGEPAPLNRASWKEGQTAPSPPNAELCRRVWDALIAQPEHQGFGRVAAFDSRKIAFSALKFTGKGSVLVAMKESQNDDKIMEWGIKLTEVTALTMDTLRNFVGQRTPLNAIEESVSVTMACLDILLKHDHSRRPGVIISSGARKFFNGNSGDNIGLAAQVLKGFFQSVRPTSAGVVLNLNVAYSPYVKAGDLQSVCFEMVGRTDPSAGAPPTANRGRGGGRGGGAARGVGRAGDVGAFTGPELRWITDRLKGARIQLSHRPSGRAFFFHGFGQGSPAAVSFTVGAKKGDGPSATQVAKAAASGARLPTERQTVGGRKISVAEYFKETYNYRDDNPALQVVLLRKSIGDKDPDNFPIGVCKLLPGKAIAPTKLNPDQAAQMIKIAGLPPHYKKPAIEKMRGIMQVNERMKAFGVNIGTEMSRVQGRLLIPPTVQYANGPSRVKNGSWNLVGMSFTGKNQPLDRWGVINYSRTDMEVLKRFIGKITQQATSRGMVIKTEKPFMLQGTASPVDDMRTVAKQIMGTPGNKDRALPQLMVIILENQKHYDRIKRSAFFDLPAPIVTQVMLSKNVTKENPDQYIGNVCLKINLKLNGSNWTIPRKDMPGITDTTMVFGADATHPPPGSRGEAISITAVIASANDQMTSFNTQVREQKRPEGQNRPEEIITDLESMVYNLIRKWKGSKGQRPKELLFFRDGVGEGQYKIVIDREVTAIKAACNRLDAKHPWKLTYVICAKRTQVRFFPTNPQDVANDKTGNLPAGTCVDNTVTHPYLFDFYLQAHSGLVGTAKPCHYVVLLNEGGFTMDSMQQTVNSLCYTFARATRSVSVVPMAYYADIVCTKARSYVYNEDDDTGTVFSGQGSDKFNPLRIQDRVDKMTAAMWYM